MSNYYYGLCCQHKGKYVHIHDKSGRSYYGKIVDVDRQFVYLESERGRTDLGGYGYGWYGGGYGYRRPIFPIALAGIAGFALGVAFSPFFFW
ncbi:hypothetical protein ACJ2A9_04040 [Anaerobacillus sp. MEB173]|uniref:hypothetical protein n=1 Tax=Anaerobacillus sp. MEB173 TaxID=3383345 RepID=UPI003F919A00